MKKYLFIAAAAMFALPSMAAEDAPKKMTSAAKKAAMLEKYDTNKDGKLDAEEKAKMKEDLKKQKEEEREAKSTAPASPTDVFLVHSRCSV